MVLVAACQLCDSRCHQMAVEGGSLQGTARQLLSSWPRPVRNTVPFSPSPSLPLSPFTATTLPNDTTMCLLGRRAMPHPARNSWLPTFTTKSSVLRVHTYAFRGHSLVQLTELSPIRPCSTPLWVRPRGDMWGTGPVRTLAPTGDHPLCNKK